MHKYQELEVWKKSIDLSERIYELTKSFPKEEKYGLKSQMRRSSVSVPSNIAEGAGRNTKGEFRQFLGIAVGSLFELETQLLLAERFKYIREINQELENIESLKKMLSGLQRSLS